jgi:translation initiation factor 3 subunit A
MYKYVDLAVELRQGRKVKDALINYRNTCQQVNVGSLEEVIRYLVDTASARAEAARAEAQSRLDDVADLEEEASPEAMMLAYVSGEKSADRTDRELVTPWFKFLWETHRNVLDVLRNNSRLEALYAAAAGRAFAFCQTYRRTTEFRRLCDILRNHLANLVKYRDQGGVNRTDLNLLPTWELYVDVRFDQLRAACELELWAEAFRSVEDIQGLVALAPKGVKGPKPALMAVYYARLTQIFTRSEARLYNAYAWYRLFIFSRSFNKALTPGDVAAMASNVVLSALAVPPYDPAAGEARTEEGRALEAERAVKMAGVLGFSVGRRDGRALLSRAALLADVERKGLLALVPPEVKAVYAALEGEFNPLQLCGALAPLLEGLPALGASLAPSPACPAPAAAALEAYVPYLQQVALARTVRQLSEVYSVMRVSALSDLAPFGYTFAEAEALIVEAVRHGYLHARFDHRAGTVHFGRQELESERVKGHLSAMAKRLTRALAAAAAPGAGDAERAARRAALVRRALGSAADDNARALARKVMIERRKEDAERVLLEREREAEEARAAAEAVARDVEERRKEAERAKRETDRIRREMEDAEQAQLRALLESRGKKIGEGERLDAGTVGKEVHAEALSAAQDLQRKLAKLGRQLDHLERAKREEEAPLRAEQAALRAAEAAAAAEAEAAAAAAAHRAAWERDLAAKRRLEGVRADADAFAAGVQQRRAAEFEALSRERARAVAEARAARKAEREVARKREYVRRCRAELEERRRAEDEAAAAEEAERAAREAVERQRKLEELAERQRLREAEIDAKAAAERGGGAAPAASAPAAAPAAAAAAAPATGAPGKFVPRHLRGAAGGGAGDARPAPAAGGLSPRRDDRARSPPRDGERPGAAWRPGGARREERGPDERPAGAYRAPVRDDRDAGRSAGGGGSRW